MIARGIKFEVDGREYSWNGGFGNIFESHERGIKQGDVRIIGDRLFYAYFVGISSPWHLGKKVVWWSIQNVDCEKVMEVRKEFFCEK